MTHIRFKSALRLVLAALILGLCTFVFVWSRTRWIPAGYVGVIYDASSGLQNRVITPRAEFVGWRQQLYIYPTKLQNAIYTQDAQAGEVKSADGIQITTIDNASTIFDVVVTYRVEPANVVKVFNSFGPIPIEDIQTTQIRRATKEAANVVGTQYDLFALMGPARAEASAKITEELRKRLSVNGITVEFATLGTCYPSSEMQQKITARVNSYVDLEISKLKRQIAEIERQVAMVRGEADAQARALSASQTKDRSIDALKLDAQALAIAKWDGSLPPISTKPGQTVIVSPDSLSRLGGSR